MIVFFFKQKTAYEVSSSLVGSEMCLRDRQQHRKLPALVLPTALAVVDEEVVLALLHLHV